MNNWFEAMLAFVATMVKPYFVRKDKNEACRIIRYFKTVATILFVQNDPTDPPHLVATWLEEIGFKSFVIHGYKNEKIPQQVPLEVDGDKVAAIIPLGGSMAAWESDKFSWLEDEYELIRDAYKNKVPILGICLGAQLMAHALGGKVERGVKSEIGVAELFNVGEDKNQVFNFPGRVKSANYHQDYITQLPPDSYLIASSDLCQNQIFAVGENSYAIQSHPEIDAEIFADWEADTEHAVEDYAGISYLEQVKQAEAEMLRTWKKYIQNWGQLVLSASN